MIRICKGCGSTLQTLNSTIPGFVKKEQYDKAIYCERCFKIMHYGSSDIISTPKDINTILEKIKEDKSPILYLVDPLDMTEETFLPLKNIPNKKIIVVTKKDLLPKSVKDKKIIKYIYDLTNIKDVYIISSVKKYNIDLLYNKIKKYKKVYVVGYTGSGKSTFINSLLSSDISKITTSPLPNTTLDLINIELSNFTIVDTPGITDNTHIANYILADSYKKLIVKKEIRPKIYHLKQNYSLILDNLIKIDSVTNSNLVFYLNNNIKYRKMKSTTKSDLISKEKVSIKVDNLTDIVIKGLGFIKVLSKGELVIYVPNKKIIGKRKKLV